MRGLSARLCIATAVMMIVAGSQLTSALGATDTATSTDGGTPSGSGAPSHVGLRRLTSPPPPAPNLTAPAGSFGPTAGGSSTNYDTVSPPADRSSAQPVSEVVADRTATSETWVDTDGSKTVRLFSEPKFFKSPDGSWTPIDSNVVPDASAPGWVRSAANSWTARFGPTDGKSVSTEVTLASGATIGFSPVAASTSTPEISKGTSSEVAYHSVWPAVDVVDDVSPVGVKESLVLQNASAPTSFAFDLSDNVIARSAPDGGASLLVAGNTVASVPPPTVTDALGDDGSLGDASLGVQSDATGRPAALLLFGVSAEWLKSLPSDAFPVVIDPSVYLGANGSWSIRSNGAKDTTSIKAGVSGGVNWRGLAHIPYETYLNQSPPYQVISAFLILADQTGCSPSPCSDPTQRMVKLYKESSLTPSYTSLISTPNLIGTATDNGGASFDVTSTMKSWIAGNVANQGFGLQNTNETTSPPKVFAWGSIFGTVQLQMQLFQAPPATTVTSPTAGTVLSSATPQLSAAAVSQTRCDGYVNYDFKIATGSDGTGGITDSGWLNPNVTQWTVPTGTLVDGITYYASVVTSCIRGLMTPLPPGGYTKFSINLRLGSGGPSPTDTVGATPAAASSPSSGAPSPGTPPASVTVNLVTGNLAAGVQAPSVGSVGGPIGFGLSYNSLTQAAANGQQNGSFGLWGRYFHDTQGLFDFGASDVESADRLDPAVLFDWTTQPAIAALQLNDPMLVRWTGYITLPAGTWALGTVSRIGNESTAADGMRVYVDGTAPANIVTNNWNWTNGAAPPVPLFGSNVTGGLTHQIQVEFWTNRTKAPVAQLWVKSTSNPDPDNPYGFPVQSSWLSRTPAILPPGWQLSTNPINPSWVAIRDQGTSVTAYAADGSTVEFTKTTGAYQGAYAPPPGYDESLTKDANGVFQLITPDNYAYEFNVDGTLRSIKSLPDDLHPAAPQYTYTGTPPLLTSVTDPVSGRSVTLTYGGSCYSGQQAPVGMLCLINYSSFKSQMQTSLWYDSYGRLAFFANPGDTETDFGYDSNGRLSDIRDPLMVDAETNGYADGTNDTTHIDYTADGRVQDVISPAPASGQARPERTYTYDMVNRTSSVAIAGFNPNQGYAERVLYDANSRIISTIVPISATTTKTTQTIWDAHDHPVVTIDGYGLLNPTGEQTTTVYDTADRPTDVYGPAPWPCFTTTTPYTPVADPIHQANCGVAVPHSTTAYDTTFNGLAAAYWSTNSFTGSPTKHATGLGDPNHWLSHDWGTTPPVTPDGNGHWSLRLDGLINLSAATYTFEALTRQLVNVYLDDQPIVTAQATTPGQWTAGTFSSAIAVTAGWHRLRVDYVGGPNGDGFTIEDKTTGSYAIIPESSLDPNYTLRTLTTDPDGKTVQTNYSDAASGIGPELGLVTSTIQAPGLLNLTTTTTYETPSTTTYLRRLKKVLPGQDPNNATTYQYYGGTDSPLTNTCGVASNVPQAGFLKEQDDPDPDGGGPLRARVQQFVYDALGRQVGRRVNTADQITSTSWICTTYDDRGRVTSQSWPAFGSAAARTVTYTYNAIGGPDNPLVASVSDTTSGTITAQVDLLGHIVSYTDSTQHTTTTAYDQANRVISTNGPQGNVVYQYTPDTSQLLSIQLDGNTLATVTYDQSMGRIQTVAYGNGTTLQPGYDSYGNTNSEIFPSVVRDDVTYSPGHRVIDETVDTSSGEVDPNPSGPNFTYDGAGRLTAAYVPNQYEVWQHDPVQNIACQQVQNPNSTIGADIGYWQTLPDPNSQTVNTANGACYDYADRETEVCYLGDNQSNTCNTGFSYDAHGNATIFAGTNYGWDSSDRNVSVGSGANTVTYARDSVDRITIRTAPEGVTKYVYGGYSDDPIATLNSLNQTIERFISLPGGVLVTKRTGGDVWSYPNLQGDIVATTDGAGNLVGSIKAYDPYGNVVNSDGSIGGASLPDNSNGSADYGAYGKAQRIEEHGPDTVIQMGARPYSPYSQRFLAVDPVEGGCANDYAYVRGDPENSTDLTGMEGCGGGWTDILFSLISKRSGGDSNSICGFAASRARSTGRTIYQVTVLSGSLIGAADICFSNITAYEPSLQVVSSGPGFIRLYGTTKGYGTGFYSLRVESEDGTPAIDINTDLYPKTTIHFQKPPCAMA